MLCLGPWMIFYQCFAHLYSDLYRIWCLTYAHSVFEPFKNSMQVGAGKVILSLWAQIKLNLRLYRETVCLFDSKENRGNSELRTSLNIHHLQVLLCVGVYLHLWRARSLMRQGHERRGGTEANIDTNFAVRNAIIHMFRVMLLMRVGWTRSLQTVDKNAYFLSGE
jgi:hypothetical protein